MFEGVLTFLFQLYAIPLIKHNYSDSFKYTYISVQRYCQITIIYEFLTQDQRDFWALKFSFPCL